MFEPSKILIYKAIIHTLHKEEEEPRCATYEIDHEEELTHHLFTNYLEKIMTSNQMKWASFEEGSEVEAVLEELLKDPSIFVEVTKDLSKVIQKNLNKYREYLPSCDMAFILFEMEDIMYLGIVKLNHKNIYVRKTEKSPGGELNLIKNSNDLYIQPKSTVEEGMVIHLPHMDIALIDKEYKVEGEKQSFFADISFSLHKGMSEKEKLKSFNQINKRLQEKFIGEDLEQKAQIKKAISDTLVDTGLLDVSMALDKAFDESEEIKNIYKEALGKVNLTNEKILIDNNAARRKFDVQKITTSSGIELTIPVEYFNDDSKVEIISNSDGTLTFMIKGIEEFISS